MATMDGSKMIYGSLEDAATKITKAGADLDEVTTFLDTTVKALEGNWEGDSYNAFVNVWSESKPTMLKLKEAVEQFSVALKNSVARQKETDATSEREIQPLAF